MLTYYVRNFGMGDELLATALARQAQEADPKHRRVRILGGEGANDRGWCPIWDNNPRLVPPEEDGNFNEICVYPANWPYLDVQRCTPQRFVWKEFSWPKGEIYLSQDERAWAKRQVAGLARRSSVPLVMCEPNVKAYCTPGKQWGFAKWQELVNKRRDVMWIQPVYRNYHERKETLRNIVTIETPSFRHGCALLAEMRAAVLPEGGLHHAAAALNVRAVVIYGGYTSPLVSGYAEHINIAVNDWPPCGSRVECAHCRDAMAQISVERVSAALDKILGLDGM